MKSSNMMQTTIAAIAKRHGLDLTAAQGSLTLNMAGYDCLSIEKIAPHLVSVTHYFEQNGDLVQDPEIVFWIGPDGLWYASEITQVYGGWKKLIWLQNAESWEKADLRGQADAASFGNTWARNIKAQGWLKDASKAA